MQQTALEIRLDAGSHLIKWAHPEDEDPIRHFAQQVAPQLVPGLGMVVPPSTGILMESYYAEPGEGRLSWLSVASIEAVTIATEEDIAYFGFLWQEGVEHRRAHRQEIMDGHPRIAVRIDEDSDRIYREDVAYQPVPTDDMRLELRGELIIAIDSRDASKVEAVLTKMGLGL